MGAAEHHHRECWDAGADKRLDEMSTATNRRPESDTVYLPSVQKVPEGILIDFDER